ncbi:hypothetical protein FACS1894122_10380 [Alphaproteobacteria bacterium]|nr:hypothetical protein FACS1894122_10380 [Alphaproteobacteria bacterium]
MPSKIDLSVGKSSLSSEKSSAEVPSFSVDNIINELCCLGELFGFKKYGVGNDTIGNTQIKDIPTIDLSWPNMKEVFRRNVNNIKVEAQRARADELLGLITETERITKDNIVTELKAEQKERIIKLCIDEKDCLFDFSEIKKSVRALIETNINLKKERIKEYKWLESSNHQNKELLDKKFMEVHNLHDLIQNLKKLFDNPVEAKEKFKEHLLEMLGTYSGFQRIMSLLAINLLNSGTKKMKVVLGDRNLFKAYKFGMNNNALILTPITFFSANNRGNSSILHEITHAYHNEISSFFGIPELFVKSTSLAIHTILNSRNANLIELFFPLLNAKKMDSAVEKIGECINLENILGNAQSKKEIESMLKAIIDCGFASVVISPKAIEEGLKIEDLINRNSENIIAKIIYVYVICLQDKTSSIWTNAEEILTICGLLPFTIGGQLYFVEDRQNQDIQDVRLAVREIDKLKPHYQLSNEFAHCQLIADKITALNGGLREASIEEKLKGIMGDYYRKKDYSSSSTTPEAKTKEDEEKLKEEEKDFSEEALLNLQQLRANCAEINNNPAAPPRLATPNATSVSPSPQQDGSSSAVRTPTSPRSAPAPNATSLSPSPQQDGSSSTVRTPPSPRPAPAPNATSVSPSPSSSNPATTPPNATSLSPSPDDGKVKVDGNSRFLSPSPLAVGADSHASATPFPTTPTAHSLSPSSSSAGTNSGASPSADVNNPLQQ